MNHEEGTVFIETQVEWAGDGQHHPIIINTKLIASYDPVNGEVVLDGEDDSARFWVVCKDCRADFETALRDPNA